MNCEYGCGSTAQFKTKSGRNICAKSPNSCPANKKKNSDGGKTSYKIGRPIIWNTIPKEQLNRSWRKNKFNADFCYGGKGNHKQVLIQERGHQCEECQNKEWLTQKIKLELEHTDGDSKNNTRENLKLLCPNCHSLTLTWRRKKTQKKTQKQHAKYDDERIKHAILSSSSMNSCLKSLDLKWGSYITIRRVMRQYDIHFLGE